MWTMRIFLAGATGAVGTRLIPLLIADGHHVVATTTTPGKVARLHAAGAEPVVLDVLNRNEVLRAVTAARPDVIIHQATALAGMRSLKKFDQEFAQSNRLRTDGTAGLIDAARAAGVHRLIVQSYTGWPNRRDGGRIKTEEDPLDATPPKAMSHTLDAIRRLEAMVTGLTDLSGLVLRYGNFYGPGTSLSRDGVFTQLVRQRKLPLVGDGAGIWSFAHIGDVAQATRLAVVTGPTGLYNIVDDDPAEVAIWLPELARLLGAPPPRRVPVWLARFFIGDAGVAMMTTSRGSSNDKAKRVLNWRPAWPTWREGFRHEFS
jgi:2-alkyl-3-oxoalkanoate reductase